MSFCFIALVVSLLAAMLVWRKWGGVVLVTRNRSGTEISNLRVASAARGGSVERIGRLQPGDAEEALLGHMGEGSPFYVDFDQDGGSYRAEASVYFYGGFFRAEVTIEFHPNQRVTFFNGAFAREEVAMRK